MSAQESCGHDGGTDLSLLLVFWREQDMGFTLVKVWDLVELKQGILDLVKVLLER